MRRHHAIAGGLALVTMEPVLEAVLGPAPQAVLEPAGPAPRRAVCEQPATVASLLEVGERLDAWCHVTPVALDPAVDHRGRRFGSLLAATRTALERHRHLRGGSDSIARRVPRDHGWYFVMSLSSQRLALWDFGLSQREVPSRPTVAIDRASVEWIRPTGYRDGFGVEMRARFVDGSFIDLQALEHGRMAEVWTAAQSPAAHVPAIELGSTGSPARS